MTVSLREHLLGEPMEVDGHLRHGAGGTSRPPTPEDRRKFARWMVQTDPHRIMMEARMKISLRRAVVADQPPTSRQLVVVFCGGKCGSTTLTHFFQSLGRPTVRIHNVDHFVDEYAPFLQKNPLRQLLHLDVLLELFLAVYDSVLVVDAYRDPIERRLSSFFQNFRVNLQRAGISHRQWTASSTPVQQRLFEESILPLLENRHGIDTQIPAFFNAPFHIDRGHQKMDHPEFPEATLLKLRFGDMASWSTILADALDLPADMRPAALPHENRSADKAYGSIYAEWVDTFQIQLPSTLWGMILDPIFAKYHSPSEFGDYILRWMPQYSPPPPPPIDETELIKKLLRARLLG